MNQRDQARQIVLKFRVLLKPHIKDMNELYRIVGEAQNGPPDGAGDGSLDEREWTIARDISTSLRDIFLRLNVKD